MELEKHIVKRISESIADLKAIYLFGSRATGQHRLDSDYDVAVLAETPLDESDAFFNLQIEMAAQTEAGVNLVDLQTLPTVLKFEAIRPRRRLFCADRAFCVDFEAEVFSEYQRFQVERQPVVEAFLNSRLAYAEQ